MPTPFLKGQKRHRLQTWEISIQEAKFSLKFKARQEVPKAGSAGRVHRPPSRPGGTRMACIRSVAHCWCRRNDASLCPCPSQPHHWTCSQWYYEASLLSERTGGIFAVRSQEAMPPQNLLDLPEPHTGQPLPLFTMTFLTGNLRLAFFQFLSHLPLLVVWGIYPVLSMESPVA